MSAWESGSVRSLSGSEQQVDTSRSFRRQTVQPSIEASFAFGLREEHPFELPAVAVALHELATNAAKYGALSVAEGHVRVEWSRASDGRLVLRWTETGGPPGKPPTRQGFGTRVIDSMIRGQLKGNMHFDWRAEGLACEIVLPM
jgi:hypothetical protein